MVSTSGSSGTDRRYPDLFPAEWPVAPLAIGHTESVAIHDQVSDHLSDDRVALAAAGELVAQLRHREILDGLVVDLGCGSGLTARRLNEAGYDVLGVDISPEMIELARSNAPAAEFVVASLFDVELPPCAAVTAIGESINYALDPSVKRRDVAGFARRVFASLLPGGLVMLDAAGPGRIGPGVTNDARFEGDDWALFVRTEGADDGRSMVRDTMLFRREGELWRRSDERHRLVLYSPEVVTEQLLTAGFEVVVMSGYEDLTFPDGWNGFLGRKRP